jgi:diketogulonate reductase-like aldo/keto reductase
VWHTPVSGTVSLSSRSNSYTIELSIEPHVPCLMQTRELAKTGVRLPVLGLGTWQYQGGIEPLRAGVALGAKFIDTAESYGTEEVVGQAIRGIRNEVFLATKVSPRHFRYHEVIKAANESLRRLKTDYLDLYQLHWPNYTVPIEETLGAMEALVDQGKIKFIGVSNFMVEDLKRAQRAISKQKIVSNQVRFNLIDRTIENGLLRYCQESSISVIAHSPLATGLQSIQAMDPEGVLKTVAASRSRTIAQIALNWCLSNKGVVTIPKASSLEHVTENCQAGDFQLTTEELHLLNTKVRFHKRGLLERFARRLARHALQIAGRNQ